MATIAKDILEFYDILNLNAKISINLKDFFKIIKENKNIFEKDIDISFQADDFYDVNDAVIDENFEYFEHFEIFEFEEGIEESLFFDIEEINNLKKNKRFLN
ncbi:MAG: hypothetical protein LBF97_00620 [Elusimicrobiota bacterium]|jgi:hypothetical protein|nr:hypothetical protein [Elusimicrobiota bacterium]